jgi:hypothetical protein
LNFFACRQPKRINGNKNGQYFELGLNIFVVTNHAISEMLTAVFFEA